MLKSLFKSSKIIIYENDSKDNTLNILKDWEKEKLIYLITEKDVKGTRTERLAYARNLLYNEAMKHTFDLLIVIDLDNVIYKLTKESIFSCFNLKQNWAMLGANQIYKYYDLWALRTYDDWMPFDCWYCTQSNKPEKYTSIEYCIYSRYKKIPTYVKPIKVKSCFGGAAIYKRKYLDNCSYGTGNQLINGKIYEKCEHVDFNNSILNNGGKIYINPKFINK